MALIVVVEDDPDVSRLLSAVLVDAGHEVHVAVDGEQGVALVQQVRPDLALVDVGLPGTLDGFEVTRRIRADAAVADVPVWALTAHSRAEDVVDDDLQLQAALRQMLSRAGLDVAGAADKGEALSTAAASAPDVVVLDLSLPDGDGIEVLAELRTWSDVPVLVLTGATDPRRMLAAFEAGADDYLRKPFGPDELLARLRALLRRPRRGEEESAQRTYGALEIDLAARTVSVAGERVHLTPTEWRILGALVANPGKLLTHRWMLAEVWDGSHGDETRAALRAHLRTLRAKIGDDASAPRYIATESGAGYRWTAVEGEQPESGVESAGR